MSTTMFYERSATRTWGGRPAGRCSDKLLAQYQGITDEKRLSWTEHHRLIRRLGSGGQGVVYLSQRRSADGFTLPVALKVFSPEPYTDDRAYDEGMGRIAKVAAHVAQIQQDNLLDVHNWVDRHRIRLMEMEWVNGYDLDRLLKSQMLEWVHGRVSGRRWTYLNEVIVTAGPVQPRLKPGIAIAIIRDCLAALAALHREGIVHGDLKPSNIMIKRTGNAKIVDIGSAFALSDPPPVRTCTPAYAAPEILENRECSPRSDLASLGYVLIEMLAGTPPFPGHADYRDLLEAKRFLAQRLTSILPEEVCCNQLLMSFICGLIAPDPGRRFPNAEAAELVKEGAASFHRQLVKGDLSSEYDNEIRLWLEELEDYDQPIASE
ncbi:MAG: serine/threonine protein kinase [Pirellulales bacterium]|nr:serine/threonine protein kinase [Pirellulales bacterium]